MYKYRKPSTMENLAVPVEAVVVDHNSPTPCQSVVFGFDQPSTNFGLLTSFNHISTPSVPNLDPNSAPLVVKQDYFDLEQNAAVALDSSFRELTMFDFEAMPGAPLVPEMKPNSSILVGQQDCFEHEQTVTAAARPLESFQIPLDQEVSSRSAMQQNAVAAEEPEPSCFLTCRAETPLYDDSISTLKELGLKLEPSQLDIPLIHSLLNEMKSYNAELEQQVVTLTKRKAELITYNEILSTPLDLELLSSVAQSTVEYEFSKN